MRISQRNPFLCGVAALCAASSLWLAGPAAAQDDADNVPTAPNTSDLCPALEEDALLCASDPMSGNCVDFVKRAAKLGDLFNAQMTELPAGSENSLMTTEWWGCGPGPIPVVQRILFAIGSPQAMALLQKPPYSLLPPPPPPPPPAPEPPVPCSDLSTQVDRNLCVAANLTWVRQQHDAAYQRCLQLVAQPLQDELVGEEKAFQAALPARCAAAALDDSDPKLSGFNRARCLVNAISDRTKGMLEAHPECAAPPPGP